jgi:hypothetical protein
MVAGCHGWQLPGLDRYAIPDLVNRPSGRAPTQALQR